MAAAIARKDVQEAINYGSTSVEVLAWLFDSTSFIDGWCARTLAATHGLRGREVLLNAVSSEFSVAACRALATVKDPELIGHLIAKLSSWEGLISVGFHSDHRRLTQDFFWTVFSVFKDFLSNNPDKVPTTELKRILDLPDTSNGYFYEYCGGGYIEEWEREEPWTLNFQKAKKMAALELDRRRE